jgi:ABC-type transport system substrate-binding protein
MYATDSLDIFHMSPDAVDRARRRHAGEFVSISDPATKYVTFDKSRPPFDDVRVRQAFVLAADRRKLVDVVQMGLWSPATGGFVPPAIPGHSAGIGLPYDPERARQLLADAGYPGGRGFPAVNLLWMWYEDAPEYLQAQWRENLQVEITWEAVKNAPYWDRWEKVLPHIWFIGWVADYPDPDAFLRRDSFAHWRNDAYVGLIEQARGIMDQGERMRLYGQADQLVVEEAVIMPILYERRHLLVKPWVTRYPLVPHNTAWFLKDVTIEPH